mgnify:CR=1 FL=1
MVVGDKVAVLTVSQKDSLIGVEFAPDSYYNPVKDCNNNWIISKEEIDQTTDPDFNWLHSLTLINWCGPYVPVSGSI